MPWKPKDATKHTRKAKSAKRKRQWQHVANSMLKRTGDEGAAVRAANGVVKKAVGKKPRRRIQKRTAPLANKRTPRKRSH